MRFFCTWPNSSHLVLNRDALKYLFIYLIKRIIEIFAKTKLQHSVQLSRSVVSNSFRPHESQHARPSCPSPTPGVYPNSCPLSRWCHLIISSSVVPFSSCPQSLPASESFPMSQLFTWGGQSIGVSAASLVIYKNMTIWCDELTLLKRLWCWVRVKAGGEGDNRGWDGWMASPTWWTWVWVDSRSWWWKGRPGVLQSIGSQRVRHDWETELNWTVI